MRPLAVIRALGPVDARSVTRDSLLRWLVILMPALGLVMRFGIPLVARWLEARLGFDLVPYYPLLMSFMGVIAAGFVGTVVGFLLLDQRDDQTLPALLVTPMSLGDYLGYRLAVPTALGVVLSAAMYLIAGLVPVTATQVIVCSLCAAPLAALYAVFIGGFAANKVQGFALVKAVGILVFPAVAAWFVPRPWQDLLGVVPHYWPLRVFWDFDAGRAGSAWAHAAVGLAYQGLLLGVLTRRLGRVMRR